jgi:cobalt-zinc-cadmium efflux system protein
MPHVHSAAAANRGRLLAVFGLTLAIFAVEAIGGVAANSLALLADAGHMLTDVAGVGMALLAIWFAGRKPTNGRTYGYLRVEILTAVTNAFLLFGVAVFILYEAWRRLSEPPEIASGLMLAVALLGLAANAASLYLLRDAQRQSLNMRGAYLEVMGDFIGSAAVIVAAVVIMLTGWTTADAVASALIGLLILPRTFALLHEATDVLLEATPKGVDMDHVRQHILDAPGVVDCHDLHA